MICTILILLPFFFPQRLITHIHIDIYMCVLCVCVIVMYFSGKEMPFSVKKKDTTLKDFRVFCLYSLKTLIHNKRYSCVRTHYPKLYFYVRSISHWLTDFLIHWLTDWLADWLAHSLANISLRMSRHGYKKTLNQSLHSFTLLAL